MLGQSNLADWVEVASGRELWSVQRKIATELSSFRARVAVPSCNASGKTHLAGRLALAFYDSFQPGTPCVICKGPCRGAKIITTSSKYEHLKDNLWGEIRTAWGDVKGRVGIDGQLPPKDLFVSHAPNHFIIGQTADNAEGFQGYHAAHKLIIGDEATSVTEEVSQGITSLLASGDTRLLLIFNPTTADTYAARMSRSPGVETIKITAFDTPHFTGEHIPEGSNLITPRFLEELEAAGMGPGTYEWETRVLANFWDLGADSLIADSWFERATTAQQIYGSRQLGVDIAPYGDSENIIAWRDGLTVVRVEAFPAMRVDHFFAGPVTKAILDFDPDYVVYDADGVGAGAVGYAEKAAKQMRSESQMIGFRGALGSLDAYSNTRSAWWWNLRRRFEVDGWISTNPVAGDSKLRGQLTDIRYTIVNGKIRVETKGEMRKRGVSSPDRGDGVMYSFAMSEDLPIPHAKVQHSVDEVFGVSDRRENAMWDRMRERQQDGKRDLNAVFGVPD